MYAGMLEHYEKNNEKHSLCMMQACWCTKTKNMTETQFIYDAGMLEHYDKNISETQSMHDACILKHDDINVTEHTVYV